MSSSEQYPHSHRCPIYLSTFSSSAAWVHVDPVTAQGRHCGQVHLAGSWFSKSTLEKTSAKILSDPSMFCSLAQTYPMGTTVLNCWA